MPEWPTLSYGQQRSPSLSPPQISLDVAQAAGGGFVSAAAKGLDALATLAEKERKQRNEVQVSDAVTRATGELDDYRTQLDSDADYAGREAKFAAKAKQVYDQALGTISDRDAQQDFHIRYNRVSGALGLQVRHDRRAAEIQDARLGLQDNVDAMLNKALFARSPQEGQVYLDQAKGLIENAVKNGTLPAVMAHSMMRAGVVKLQAAQAGELIRNNPAGAIAALRDPEQFKSLDATTRQQLILHAQQRGESLGAQSRAELRADLTDYRQARAAGQPVAPDVTASLATRAKAAGLSRQFEGMKDYYDRVDSHTIGKTLPELRRSVGELEGTGQLPDLAVARAVRHQLSAEEVRQQRQLNEQFKDFEAYRSRGEPYPQLPQLLQRAEDLGGRPAVEAIQSRDAFWSRIAAAQNEPGSSVAGRLAMIERERRAAQNGELTMEDLQERDALRQALKLKTELAEKDPAAYARRFYPTIDETLRAADQAGDQDAAHSARAALVDAQRREGIPEHKIALLTKSEADVVEGRLTSPDTKTRLDEVARLRAMYGADDWQRVRRQLDQGKHLPADVEVLASLPPSASARDAQIVSDAFKLSRQEAEKNIGADRVKNIESGVRSGGDDVQAIFRAVPGGPDYYASLKTAAERVALLYATAYGMDNAMATRKAWDDVFYRHWDISAGVRVPKVNGVPVVDPGALRDRQREIIASLDKLPVDPGTAPGLEGISEARRRAITVDAIRRRHLWVTAPDDRGAYLFAAPGEPVTVRGAPVFMPFAPGVNTSIFEEIAAAGPPPPTPLQQRERARAGSMSAPPPGWSGGRP